MMIVCFLDLLGFSKLLELDQEVAYNNMITFNNVISTRFTDDKNHPIENYKKLYPDQDQFYEFVKNTGVTSFKNLISFSDSLVIGGEDIDLFITQLMSFLATVYIDSMKPFKSIGIEDKKSRYVDKFNEGCTRNHNAFPLLFRGGISVGKDVLFENQLHFKNGKRENTSLNVFGLTYLKAVKLEKTDKGPRLFCDKSVVNAISNKRMIKKVDSEKGLYEIVWTVSDAISGTSNRKWDNVIKKIDNEMLPAAMNFYNHYRHEEGLEPHYRELIKLIACGIIKYANDECDRAEDACKRINDKLKSKLIDLIIDTSVLNDFLE